MARLRAVAVGAATLTLAGCYDVDIAVEVRGGSVNQTTIATTVVYPSDHEALATLLANFLALDGAGFDQIGNDDLARLGLCGALDAQSRRSTSPNQPVVRARTFRSDRQRGCHVVVSGIKTERFLTELARENLKPNSMIRLEETPSGHQRLTLRRPNIAEIQSAMAQTIRGAISATRRDKADPSRLAAAARAALRSIIALARHNGAKNRLRLSITAPEIIATNGRLGLGALGSGQTTTFEWTWAALAKELLDPNVKPKSYVVEARP